MQAVSLHILEPDKTCVQVYFTQCIVDKIWEQFLEHILRRATSQISMKLLFSEKKYSTKVSTRILYWYVNSQRRHQKPVKNLR